MARDFDNFPTFDPVIKNDSYLSNIWCDSMATFIDSLKEYLSQNGIFVPRLTTAERDALKSLVNGMMIYNTTNEKFQGYEAGSWVNLV